MVLRKTRSPGLAGVLFWPYPLFYRPFGRLRNRGDCRKGDFDFWIDGYPRSANTFAVRAFQMANPNVRIRSHMHIPPFIINSVQLGKPGLFLIRKPEDAIMSWAIYWNSPVEPCLDYYIDFHRTLLPYASKLFLASFEAVTSDFEGLIRQFNSRMNANYALPQCPAGTVFSRIEEESRNHKGEVNELQICRPSPRRAELKEKLAIEIKSCVIAKKLEKARELHLTLWQNHSKAMELACGSEAQTCAQSQ